MANPLSISASIAGLMTIADIVIRNGYKYVTAVKNADKAVASLINEVNSLSGTLHSLRNIAEGLEGEDAPFIFTTQVHHIESCYRTLRKINELLDKFELSKTKGLVERASQRLRWPLTHSETKSLASEVSRHRETLTLALNADEMSALIVLLARQETMEITLLNIERGLERNRMQKKAAQLSDYHKRIMEWLCPAASVDPSRNQESAVSLRHPGTGVWFTDSEEFQEWKLKNNSRLWLHGIPGAGKTILMSTIIQEVENITGNNEGCAFYYCDYKAAATQDPSNILGSLIKQLALQKEDTFELLTSFYESHAQPFGVYRRPNPESLLRTLHNISDLFSLTSILIDGLDEITANRFDAVELLERIQQESPKIRTLFASRREADIEQCLERFKKISIVARSSDLELYVASEIERRTRKKELSIKDPDLKEQIMKRLIHGADGMFRWVACQIDHLCELPTDKARSKALDYLPRGLPETYERILGRVLESHKEIQDLVSRTLQWLVCAKWPLGHDALLEALSIMPGDTHLDPASMTSENDLLRWCSSLVRRRAAGDGIELAHFTVKEYLLSIDLDKDKRFAPFKICSKKSDKLLGQVCLTYLNLDHLGEYPLPEHIFDMFSDLESEAQSENSASGDISDGDEAWSDEDEDISNEKDHNRRNEDVDSDLGRPSIPTHESNEGTQLYKHRPGKKEKVTAAEAFKPSLVRFPLLLYAAVLWDSHLRSHMVDALVVCLSNQLFDPQKSYQFLWWTYAYMYHMQDEGWDRSYADATTLHWAAHLHLTDVCSWLVSQGSDVNRISEMGSPLDCALLGYSALFLDDKDGLKYRINDDKPAETEEDKAYHNSVSLIVLQLIKEGARLDKATNPACFFLPLEIAVMAHPHNNKVINHLLAAGASITEYALEIIEGYLERKNRISGAPLGTIPSGIAALFSETARNNVSYATQSIYQRISSKVANIASCEAEPESIAEHEADPDDRVAALERQFLQASEHGVYESTASLISTLRNTNSDNVDSTLVCGLGLALQNNHENVVQLLLESGVNPNIVDENGDSAAHTAVTRYYTLTDVNTMITKSQETGQIRS